MLGLDSLREVQLCSLPPSVWRVTESIKVFSARATLDRVSNVFPYMVPTLSGKKQLSLVGQLEMFEVVSISMLLVCVCSTYCISMLLVLYEYEYEAVLILSVYFSTCADVLPKYDALHNTDPTIGRKRCHAIFYSTITSAPATTTTTYADGGGRSRR